MIQVWNEGNFTEHTLSSNRNELGHPVYNKPMHKLVQIITNWTHNGVTNSQPKLIKTHNLSENQF